MSLAEGQQFLIIEPPLVPYLTTSVAVNPPGYMSPTCGDDGLGWHEGKSIEPFPTCELAPTDRVFCAAAVSVIKELFDRSVDVSSPTRPAAIMWATAHGHTRIINNRLFNLLIADGEKRATPG